MISPHRPPRYPSSDPCESPFAFPLLLARTPSRWIVSIPASRMCLSFLSLAQCPFCNPFVLMVFHLMGGGGHPPLPQRFDVQMRTLHPGRLCGTGRRFSVLRLIPCVFILLRTLLRPSGTQLFCFHAIPNSLPKTPGGRGIPHSSN